MPSKSHGATKSPEYVAWRNMRTRCNNPNHPRYADYGGRGITICPRWESFEAFLADMGPRPSRVHSLERERNNEGYSPANCKWATDREQNRNSRFNRIVELDGQRMTVAEAAEKRGLNPTTVYCRLHKGWPIERAFQPVKSVSKTALVAT